MSEHQCYIRLYGYENYDIISHYNNQLEKSFRRFRNNMDNIILKALFKSLNGRGLI